MFRLFRTAGRVIAGLLTALILSLLPPRTRQPPRAADDRVAAGDWLIYDRTYAGDRFSPLRQITAESVGERRAAAARGEMRQQAPAGARER